jgi:biopolymer transport protein ExbD
MNTLVPDDKSLVDIDTVTMRANIKDSKYNLSSDDQIKYGRAMQIFDTMKANNFNVMKGPGGVYWMESMESGKKIYA